MGTLLAVNLGNTRVGVCTFGLPIAHGHTHVLDASFPAPRGERFAPQLDGLFPQVGGFFPHGPVEAAVIASVNPPAEAAVRRWVSETFGIELLRFPDEVPPAIRNDYDPPSSLGADRLASAEAAYRMCQSACIIVDAGTAVTVDAVSADGVFLGGAILPGLGLCADALARGTALLPRVSLEETGGLAIGQSTEAGISSGVLLGVAGAIDRLVAEMASEFGGCDNLYITGGDGPKLQPLCRAHMELDSLLTLRGLAFAYARREKPGS